MDRGGEDYSEFNFCMCVLGGGGIGWAVCKLHSNIDGRYVNFTVTHLLINLNNFNETKNASNFIISIMYP